MSFTDLSFRKNDYRNLILEDLGKPRILMQAVLINGNQNPE
ncbi:MAG: hypothetical protein VX252_07240 [Myxococcota bacterium]|nr:hypothetical protein [Myxococcota bacterium]